MVRRYCHEINYTVYRWHHSNTYYYLNHSFLVDPFLGSFGSAIGAVGPFRFAVIAFTARGFPRETPSLPIDSFFSKIKHISINGHKLIDHCMGISFTSFYTWPGSATFKSKNIFFVCLCLGFVVTLSGDLKDHGKHKIYKLIFFCILILLLYYVSRNITKYQVV